MPSPVDANVVNAFLAAAQEILRTFVRESAVEGMRVADGPPPPPGVVVSIRLRGKLRGRIVWSFDPKVAKALADGMGIAPTSIIGSPESLDALGEVANLIAGNATGALSEAGYDVELSPPSTGPIGEEDDLPDKALAVTLRTPAGDVDVLFFLRPEQPS